MGNKNKSLMTDWQHFSLFNPSAEHKILREMLQNFVKNEVEPQANEFDRKEHFNLPLFRKLGEIGVLGLLVSEEFKGAARDLVSAVIVHEELASSDPGLTLSYLAHAVLCAYNIEQNAAPKQKKWFLPKLATGEWVGAMALSEPDCGTDVRAIKTKAVRKKDKYILNGRKMWITNGSVNEENTPCDCCLVYAKTRDRISLFVVEKNFPGFSVGQKIKNKLGMRASNTSELVFQDCEVPESHLLGKEGEGLKQMIKTFESERLTLAAISLGIARRCLNEMNRYSLKRSAFGKPIRSFGQIQKYLAQSYSQFQAARTYTYNVARGFKEPGSDSRPLYDGVKLVAAQMGKAVADSAIQVMGGYGYVGEYQVERFFRDAKLLEIGGGTNEALEKNISKSLAQDP